jgi:hypothetical protein
MAKNKMSKDVLSKLKNEGLFVFDKPAIDDRDLKACFRSFLNQSKGYKDLFLQSHYKFAFDGYSYQGQTDSSNQSYDDLLDTFVFSDLRPVEDFPKEFHLYLIQEWKETLQDIKRIEFALIEALDLKVNQKDLAHMVSCNFYPPTKEFNKTARENTRLSAHPDVSLFTIFPFGVKEGFSYKNPNGDWVEIVANSNWTIFPGYLLECLTNGEIKALNHKVELPMNRSEERFSFAYFSIPRQNTHWEMGIERLRAEDYFEKYLALFD